MNKIQLYRNKLEQLKGQKMQVTKTITSLKKQIKENKIDLHRHEQARQIVIEVGLKTQEQLSYHISDITSMALTTVFDDPYELKTKFILNRNKTECNLLFERNGILIKPTEAAGVGAVDIAAFALRIASWSMVSNKTRNVILLDEPFKHLKGKRENELALEMVREISHKLGIQIIMISDERIDREITVDKTDRLFEVTIKKGISKVEEI